MRYVYLLVSMAFLASFNIGWAEESADKKAAAAKTVVVEENPGQDLKQVDVGNNQPARPEEYGVDRPRVMPSWETNDENTGLPDVVESDKEGELE
jgi:hypothetical protein